MNIVLSVAGPTHSTSMKRGNDNLPAFHILLRTHRKYAELTQEQLAEKAGLSTRAISELEHGGRHTPRAYTVAALADALDLAEPDRNQFVAAARQRLLTDTRRILSGEPQQLSNCELRTTDSYQRAPVHSVQEVIAPQGRLYLRTSCPSCLHRHRSRVIP